MRGIRDSGFVIRKSGGAAMLVTTHHDAGSSKSRITNLESRTSNG